MRKLKRSVAHNNMKKRGLSHVNKKLGNKHSSYFAENWRDYVK